MCTYFSSSVQQNSTDRENGHYGFACDVGWYDVMRRKLTLWVKYEEDICRPLLTLSHWSVYLKSNLLEITFQLTDPASINQFLKEETQIIPAPAISNLDKLDLAKTFRSHYRQRFSETDCVYYAITTVKRSYLTRIRIVVSKIFDRGNF